jgi:hypothetical protein
VPNGVTQFADSSDPAVRWGFPWGKVNGSDDAPARFGYRWPVGSSKFAGAPDADAKVLPKTGPWQRCADLR